MATYTEVRAVRVFAPAEAITHSKPLEGIVENRDGFPVLMIKENGVWHHYHQCAFVVVQEPEKGTETPNSGATE